MRGLNPKAQAMEHGLAAIQMFKQGKFVEKAGFEKEFLLFVIDRFNQYQFRYLQGDFIPLVKGGKPSVEIGFSTVIYEDDKYVFILEGRIDLLGLYKEFKVFIDHKTQSRDSRLYDWKVQFLCYALATGLNRGVVNYFGLQKGYEDGKTLRHQLFYIPDWKKEEFKQYIISEVYFPIAQGIFKPNFNSCAGPDEKRPCAFSMICNAQHNETKQLIKQTFYHVVPAWTPWNEDESEDE
jgi:hypothetical protein